MQKTNSKIFSHIIVPIAHKCSGIEAVNTIGTLRKAGLRVTVASVEKELLVSLSESIQIEADKHISSCASTYFDGIVLIGGSKGNLTIRSNKLLRSIYDDIRDMGLVVALSSAPAIVLSYWGYLDSPATCSPNDHCRTIVENMAEYVDEDVVVSQNGMQITASSEASSINCSLMIVETLEGVDHANDVARRMGVEIEEVSDSSDVI